MLLIDGQRVLSCFVLAALADGEITTIEGLAAETGPLHPMQQALVECDGYQSVRLLHAGADPVGHRLRPGGPCGLRGRGPRIHER
ncbi:hypothetical protein Rumeso_04183 [Rubellimicrobium mesophilum DSM 19309]|uniref:Uncharacterized protein n=2 Tax=Rubellimicrobium TaxID=295418 RepID=A0A017HKL2_9RHOB|nr:hypothetical protein Rumeso_04183 [Rubellimicrobium mesophilum DSM 19309]